MLHLKRIVAEIVEYGRNDEKFLDFLKKVEGLASRILALAMILVILSAVFDLVLILVQALLTPPLGSLTPLTEHTKLVGLFGLFLNVLIALEILENITAYLRSHVPSKIVELVIVTALIAVARKIIILDLDSPATVNKLIGLAVAVITISTSYWIVWSMNAKHRRS